LYVTCIKIFILYEIGQEKFSLNGSGVDITNDNCIYYKVFLTFYTTGMVEQAVR